MSDLGSEYGRLLAERDRLIADGADPADLEVVLRPPVEGDPDFDATAIDYRRGSPQYDPTPAETGLLDTAWKAAEAALPEGWTFWNLTYKASEGIDDDRRWSAMAAGPFDDMCPTCFHSEPRKWLHGYGATHAAALLDLAAAIRTALSKEEK